MNPRMYVIENNGLKRLIEVLRDHGYTIMGPLLRGNAIVYDEIHSFDDLTAGIADDQYPGSYRTKKQNSPEYFRHHVGAHSWKRYLHPPVLRLWKAEKNRAKFTVHEEPTGETKTAFLGVRPCDIHAMMLLDTVFQSPEQPHPRYKIRRENVFVVAVNCTEMGRTCFCSSMKTGPKAESGFDIALTEIVHADRHYFLLETGSERGKSIVSLIPHREATRGEVETGNRRLQEAAGQSERSVDTRDVVDLLERNTEHPRWEMTAERCLSCANCTMVCPTCFCTTVEDTTDLAGTIAERWRKWDSCFTLDFSYIHGGSIRSSVKSRYRQWLTHKFSTWQGQFGALGCVGCGRCITWCPVGIDVTEEIRMIQGTEPSLSSRNSRKENDNGNP